MPFLLSERDRERLLRAAEILGRPGYAYLADRIAARVERLRAALPASWSILYSHKANPHPEVIAQMRRLGVGADVASEAELSRAIALGYQGESVSFAGPGKSRAEIERAVSVGAHLVVESAGEAEEVERAAEATGRFVAISVRVNPSAYQGPFGQTIAAAPSQFGVDEEQLDSFVNRLRDYKHLELGGIHVFPQSRLLSSEAILENFRRTFAMAGKLARRHGIPVKRLNLGGFGVPYFSGEKELELDRLGQSLSGLDSGRDGRVFVETGRYLVADSGFYLTRVLYKKESRGKVFLVTDGGISHHLAATGIDQMVKKNFPVFNLTKFGKPAEDEVTIAGPSCYFADQLLRQAVLPPTDPGDVIAVGMSGAYGPTFSPVNFLSRPLPGEVYLE